MVPHLHADAAFCLLYNGAEIPLLNTSVFRREALRICRAAIVVELMEVWFDEGFGCV